LRVTNLSILNFRNISKFNNKFEPAGAIIFGKNGTGKTNLLEAISYFAFGKSMRSALDTDLVSFSKAFFRLKSTFVIQGKEIDIEAAFDNKRKLIKLDDCKIDKISELYKYAKVVYFSPEDIELVNGGPSLRRKFIDLAISQTSYKYLESLRTYKRILKQRNALLKTNFSYKEKKIWDERFARFSEEIIENRLEYLEAFIPLLCDKYYFVSGQEELLSIEYKFSFPRNGEIDFLQNFKDHLEAIENDEIRLQRTLAGPHLDDIEFSIKGKPARNFGSQGQKRSLAITARLVQAYIIKEKNNDSPILIFDDVLADLDRVRSRKIMDVLEEDHQIFIATSNLGLYEDFGLESINLERILNE
jgi:DNA replication and repair protein RecF